MTRILRVTPEWIAERERKRVSQIGNVEMLGDVGHAEATGFKTVRIANARPLPSLIALCRGAGLPIPEPEYRFSPSRRWRADYCWPAHMLMLEIEGGLWMNGRHSRGSGAIADLEKYSEAAILGYRIIYATPDEVRNGVAFGRIARALGKDAA